MSRVDRAEQVVNDVLQEGISVDARQKIYDDWTETYDEDLKVLSYTGPRVVAQAVAECFPGDRENKIIIDIAAGTGLVGEELRNLGFKIIDALDPSQKMLDFAKKKSIYRNFICDFITEKPLDIKENIYDALTISGGMGNGHLPCGALHEMIRLVKPGGFIVIVTNPLHLDNVQEYKGRFEPLVDQLEMEGKWKKVKKEVFPKYASGIDGLLMIYKIC